MSFNPAFTTNIETMYQNYLKAVKLDEKNMGSLQRKETRQAFIAGLGYMLVTVTELGKQNEVAAIAALDHMRTQITVYFNTITGTEFFPFSKS